MQQNDMAAKAVIVMPTTTPLIKVNRTKSYGAEVVLYGDVYDEACAHAYELAEKNGYTFVHPFDDLAVATGQGTIAMEIFKELPISRIYFSTDRRRRTCNRCIYFSKTVESEDQSDRCRTGRCKLYESIF